MAKKEKYLRESLINKLEKLFKLYKNDFKTIQVEVKKFGFIFSVEEIEKLYNNFTSAKSETIIIPKKRG